MINQLRAFLLERGLVFPRTPAKLKTAMAWAAAAQRHPNFAAVQRATG